MTVPSVGRIVHYHPGAGDPDSGTVLAAIVTYVFGPACVNLAVFNPNGIAGTRRSVYFCDGSGEHPPGPYAEWPPRV